MNRLNGEGGGEKKEEYRKRNIENLIGSHKGIIERDGCFQSTVEVRIVQS